MHDTRRWTLTLLVATALATASMAADGPVLRPGDAGISGRALQPYQARYADSQGRERLVELEEARYPGGDGLRLVIAMVGSTDTVYDEIQVLRQDLSPVLRSISALSMLHQVEVFGDGVVRGVRLAADGTSSQALKLPLEGDRFAGGMDALVLAGQPLAEGYSARLALFSSDMGPMANLTSEVRVVGRETVEAAGRKWSTWVVESRYLDTAGEPLAMPDGSPFPAAKHWLVDEPPYSVRSTFGEMVRVDLVSLGEAAGADAVASR